MSWLPQVNARLYGIIGQGLQKTYGKAATAGSSKWSGESDAYLTEKLRTGIVNNELNRVKQTTLIIPGDLRPTVDIKPGDKVHFTYQGKDLTVEILDVTAKIGPPGTPRTVRLELQAASVDA